MDRLPTYVIAERGTPAPARAERLLVLLHGYDATEHDLTSIGPLLDPDGRYLVAGIRGPVPTEGTGTAWFSYKPLGPDPDTFHPSLAALDATVNELCAEHVMRRDEVVFAGFSQGAAMALAVSLGRGLDRPAGAICLSGFLADVRGLDYGWDERAGLPVLVQHGTEDETVPVELGRDTAATLEHHGLAVTYDEHPIGHQTTLESLTVARTWLVGLAGARSSSRKSDTRHT